MHRAAYPGGTAMFRLSANLAVYLHRGTIDFRKNINGLSALVEHHDGRLEIGPLANLPVVRDLVTDMREFFDKSSHQYITIRECAQYLGLDPDEVDAVLNG